LYRARKLVVQASRGEGYQRGPRLEQSQNLDPNLRTWHLAIPIGHIEPVRRIAHARIEHAGRQHGHHIPAVAVNHLDRRETSRTIGVHVTGRPFGLGRAGGSDVACALHALTVARAQPGSRAFDLAVATSIKTVKTIKTVKSVKAEPSKR
jgi:hypothetical protein